MPRSPFQIAFDHIDDCPSCSIVTRQLCPTGRVLFQAAHDACRLITEPPTENKTKA